MKLTNYDKETLVQVSELLDYLIVHDNKGDETEQTMQRFNELLDKLGVPIAEVDAAALSKWNEEKRWASD